MDDPPAVALDIALKEKDITKKKRHNFDYRK
jgi:hypothetical protein